MKAVCRWACAMVFAVTSAAALQAQQPAAGAAKDPQAAASKPADQKPAEQKPAQKPDQKPEQKPDEPQKYEETVVVSASKSEEKLINAPATMTVIGSRTIESAPTQNFAELLRAVPGVNITQVSARDINVTTRGATGTLATGQLALLDGRSLYQDFFGFVMWDFLPVNLNEIKQIEVIRGPASAVWGANALNGVVNVITKSPREMQGTSAVLGVGGFDRQSGATGTDTGSGTLFYISGTHAQAVNDRVAFKISAGGYTQDPYSRPTGAIPCDRPAVCTAARNPYPNFTNQGSTQPKFDTRVDYDSPSGSKLVFSGGVAGTDGIMHTGIGPFDINRGSVMGYGKVNYTKKAFRAGFFTNILNGDAANLLTVDASGKPIGFNFATKTFDFEASNVQAVHEKHVLTYGGNLRFNSFDLSLAPLAQNRTEGGGYVQDEVFLSKMFRLVAGARVDRFDYLNDFVFSPRVAFMVKPEENQTIRVSYNRAYRSPSVINNFLDITIAEPLNLGLFSPLLAGRTYLIPIHATGNQDLTETSVDSYEIGYSGVVAKGRAIVSSAFYVNRTKNDIFFTELTAQRWTATNPPPNFAFGLLPPAVIALTPAKSFPAAFTYLNFGRTTQKGFELGVNSTVNRNVGLFANYSFQANPTANFDLSELNLPAKNRFNIGVNFNRSRYLGDLNVSYSDSAFWQDVLDDRYHGTTDAYTLINGGFGVKWAGNRVTTSVKGTNLGNQTIQQHVFGDIIKRQVVGELRVNF
jgi:outer membrane receptor protein involved in Fe transport